MKLLLGITGASGMLFVTSFLGCLENSDVTIHGICSDSGEKVLQHEQDLNSRQLSGISLWFDVHDMGAGPASGSSDYDAMVILPCTMGSLGAIAAGVTYNLIHRAADVMLKERKKLVLGVRETPFNRTHLTNMLALHDAGAIICPTMPSYYLCPKSLEEAAQSYCWRLCDQLGIFLPERKRWKS